MTIYTTYESVGQKEQVDDIISMITPWDVPFQSTIGSERAYARMFEWQEDDLRAVAANAQSEGFEATEVVIAPTTMRSNYTQILSETIKISVTADVVETYGRARETSWQLTKSSRQLRRDLEHAFIGVVQAAAAGDNSSPGAGTARTMASAYTMMDAGVTETITGSLDDDAILNCAEKVYLAGGEFVYLMVTPSDSVSVANLAYATGRQRDIRNETRLVNVIDLLATPFGEMRVLLNRFQLAGEAVMFDPAYWKQVALRPWARETLAKTGDSTKIMIVGEYSLKHRNFSATGRITGIGSTA